jgi:hypothetical protein
MNMIDKRFRYICVVFHPDNVVGTDTPKYPTQYNKDGVGNGNAKLDLQQIRQISSGVKETYPPQMSDQRGYYDNPKNKYVFVMPLFGPTVYMAQATKKYKQSEEFLHFCDLSLCIGRFKDERS